MCFTENQEDRISIVQMNSEPRHAELELLSAHCATHTEETVSAPATGLNDQQILQAVEYVSSYLRDQRERYLPSAAPLSEQHRAVMRPYFSTTLLEQIKVVELQGARLPNPPFYAEAKALGFVSLPELTHMNSLTFFDVLVFNEGVTQRSLFHALVHAVQFQVLGLERYTELFVQSFLNTRFHFRVPIEAHAFFLESKFVRPAAASFSVEDQVRLWVKQNRY
jgi:hypothetical protein